MFDTILTAAAGFAAAVAIYFAYLAATKGLPAAVAWAKAKWTAGAAEIATIKADIESLKLKAAALEQRLAPPVALATPVVAPATPLVAPPVAPPAPQA